MLNLQHIRYISNDCVVILEKQTA